MKEMDDAIYFKIKRSDHEKIKKKMFDAGIVNESAYIRKMAIDGMIIKLNMPEITQLNSLLRRYNNNLNQIAKKVNSTGTVYQNEIEEIKNNQNIIYENLNEILKKLSALG